MNEPARLLRGLAAFVLFGVAFGIVEAAVVIDLHAVYDPIHARMYPDRTSYDLFPLLTIDQLRAHGELPYRLLRLELVREAATLVMLGAVALAYARNPREGLAGFMLGFGIWDLAFYGVLRLAIGWPSAFGAWDLLFLLPVPWASPVAAPMMISLGMIITSVAILWRESRGHPVRLGAPQLALVGLGALVMIGTFCVDWRSLSVGGRPADFPWMIFGAGGGIGAAGFVSGFLNVGRAGRA